VSTTTFICYLIRPLTLLINHDCLAHFVERWLDALWKISSAKNPIEALWWNRFYNHIGIPRRCGIRRRLVVNVPARLHIPTIYASVKTLPEYTFGRSSALFQTHRHSSTTSTAQCLYLLTLSFSFIDHATKGCLESPTKHSLLGILTVQGCCHIPLSTTLPSSPPHPQHIKPASCNNQIG
jgi:hypothetical protein